MVGLIMRIRGAVLCAPLVALVTNLASPLVQVVVGEVLSGTREALAGFIVLHGER